MSTTADVTTTVVVRTIPELREQLAPGNEPAPGSVTRPERAVVMTMGALHSGHLELVRAARTRIGPAGHLIVTIFVNPLQFGPHEDFDSYPRDLAADLALLEGSGADVDVVFAPAVEEMYPSGPIVRVSSGRIGQVLEGALRPGHFDGVLTVVLKLLNLTRPDVAFFGEKDAQQLLAIRRMAADLDLPVEIAGVPIVRDPDGLALSSRNTYLSDAERARALALSAALRAGSSVQEAGTSAILTAAASTLAEADVGPDYLVLVDPTNVEQVSTEFVGPALLLVAARVGQTRLIDNTAVNVQNPASAGDMS